MSIEAYIIADSVGVDAKRILTYELLYPLMIHAELMTHRVFSRNAASSRAIPTARMLAAISEDCAKPAEWRMNEPGMQGHTTANEVTVASAELIWHKAMSDAMRHAKALDALGLHKQHVNRVLAPFTHIRTVVTSTQWQNWDGLRNHEDADPTIAALARKMIAVREKSEPSLLLEGAWHLPYADGKETMASCLDFVTSGENTLLLERLGISLHNAPDRIALEVAKRVSASRCARTSYKTHDGQLSTVAADMKLFEKLVTATLLHASPLEHQVTPDNWLTRNKRWMTPLSHGNLVGWQQFRKQFPFENLDVVEGAAF